MREELEERELEAEQLPHVWEEQVGIADASYFSRILLLTEAAQTF